MTSNIQDEQLQALSSLSTAPHTVVMIYANMHSRVFRYSVSSLQTRLESSPLADTVQLSSVAKFARPRAVMQRRSLLTPTAVRSGNTTYPTNALNLPGLLTLSQTADLVQEMYLRELKNYKPPQIKASDAEGHVQKFQMPKPPASPEEGDIATDLKAYESQEVELESQVVAASATAVKPDYFLEDDDDDEEAPAAH